MKLNKTWIDQVAAKFAQSNDGAFDKYAFAEQIVNDFLAEQTIYLLSEKDITEPDTEWKLSAWTQDLTVAHKWRGGMGPHRGREFQNLRWVRQVKTVDEL